MFEVGCFPDNGFCRRVYNRLILFALSFSLDFIFRMSILYVFIFLCIGYIVLLYISFFSSVLFIRF